MKCLLGCFIALACTSSAVFSQKTYSLSGKVTDENHSPLPGASVTISPGDGGTITDRKGFFEFSGIAPKDYALEVSFMGYEKYRDTLNPLNTEYFHVHLLPSVLTLDEVVITDGYSETRKMEDPRNIEIVSEQFIKANLSGSLMKSLERLPGVGAIEIGSGQSKPLIRGLGFNRVTVVENGIKHEGQQWGAEHGLEIDQYAVDRVEVIKGPASLQYGSDAIGGIIDIRQLNVPVENSFGGAIELSAKNNNNLLGSSVNIYGRKKRLFFTSRITIADYADFRVPTDSVDIYSYRAALYKNRLRNTAGNERNIHFSMGSLGKRINHRLFISNLSSTSGFFANAHGLEPRRVDTLLHDKSDRDIQFPYQRVNHFKAIGKSDYRFGNHRLETEFGYQNNFRQEWSPYVSHGYMPPIFPENLSYSSGLELMFDKDVFSGNLKGIFALSDKLSLTAGLSSEYQENAIGGRGFIIPAFGQFSAGGFGYGKYSLSAKSLLHTGLRYDFGKISINEYSDWFESPILNEQGDTIRMEFLSRAVSTKRNFNSISWSVGYNYNNTHFSLKANAGKSFRMPIAKELAANGVNYHHFSYEVGDKDLSAETSYQLDLGMEWNYTNFALGLSPFLNYFPNYIYLNPTYKHDYLYGAGNQVYQYTQSEVLRFGGEIHTHYNLLKQLQSGFIGEYVYSRQVSGEKKGFTLPFSPPVNLLFSLKYAPRTWKYLSENYLGLDLRIVLAQDKIVPPEIKTPGYQTLNISGGTRIRVKKQLVSVNLQVQNLLNRKYFNHTSYYRIINVPESGRNFIINVSIPLNFKK